MQPRLQHVTVTFQPQQEQAMRAFYLEVLDLEELPVPVADKGWLWFAAGDEGVELHLMPDAASVDRTRRQHFCLQVASLPDARAQLRAHDVAVDDPSTQIPGRPRLFCRDPAGNRIELTEHESTTK